MTLKDIDTEELVKELRDRGNVVIVWAPEDIQTFMEEDKLSREEAQDILAGIGRGLQEHCIETGWEYIMNNL